MFRNNILEVLYFNVFVLCLLVSYDIYFVSYDIYLVRWTTFSELDNITIILTKYNTNALIS